MTRELITGQTGFVGYWMTHKTPDSVEWVGGGRDFYDSGLMEYLNDITHIVHLAPVAPYKVLEWAKKWNARLLYCSSGIVYYPEVDTRYRHDKLRWENDCLESGVDVVIARLFTFFGERLDGNKAITQFFANVRKGEPIRMYGDGSTVRTYMHGRDLGVQMWRILLEGESGQAYDVGSTRKTTIRRLAERISAFTGARIERLNVESTVPEYYPRDTRRILD